MSMTSERLPPERPPSDLTPVGLVTSKHLPGRPGATVDSERAEAWASTMGGTPARGVRLAHGDGSLQVDPVSPLRREQREAAQDSLLSPGATRASGAGRRQVEEAPDEWRTCFERDRDRIVHRATAFRRLAGKTQVFIFPDDHQRTRLTHALEVAQVAVAIARACGCNVALTEAIALGHDCGHGPGGHASEDALGPYLPEGFDHAPWGADVVLAPLNLCEETLDGIRNHSWSRPAPATPEGEIVAWADRIAYVCHDFEDAVAAGIVGASSLPTLVTERCGNTRPRQLDAFIRGVVEAVTTTGRISMVEHMAEALAEFRRFNYERIYMRPASLAQANSVITLLRALVEHYSDRPNLLPGTGAHLDAGGADAVRAAVTYVAGMTDRFACRVAVAELGWNPDQLPRGIDVSA